MDGSIESVRMRQATILQHVAWLLDVLPRSAQYGSKYTEVWCNRCRRLWRWCDCSISESANIGYYECEELDQLVLDYVQRELSL